MKWLTLHWNCLLYTYHRESLKSIEGPLSFFDEADAAYDESSREPSAEEVITAKRAKRKGQRNIDLKDFPEEIPVSYTHLKHSSHCQAP